LSWSWIAKRVLEVVREIGTLMIAFAPLDFAVSGSPLSETWPILLVFLLSGFVLVAACILSEWRLHQ
jgi:hypothetical protein